MEEAEARGGRGGGSEGQQLALRKYGMALSFANLLLPAGMIGGVGWFCFGGCGGGQ